MPGDGFIAHVIAASERPETVGTKRLAWAYGCAKRGNDIERVLLGLLQERFAELAAGKTFPP